MTINNEQKKFWMPILAGFITAVLGSSLGYVFYAGQSSAKLDATRVAVQQLQSLTPKIQKVDTLESQFTDLNNRFDKKSNEIDNLKTQITVAQTTLDKVDRMYDLLQGMDKKLSEFQITNEYVQRDLKDFRTKLQDLEKSGDH